MKVFEFEIPSFYMPIEPYWLPDLKSIIISTDNLLPKSEYYGPIYLSKIISYNQEPKSIKKILTDFVIFSNFLNQNYPLFFWIYQKTLNDLTLYEKEIDNIDSYVNQSFTKTDWHLTIDYDKYPLLELTPKPSEIKFNDYFFQFYQLSLEDPYQAKIRRLIEFFAFNYLTTILNKIYSNTNLAISNSFVIIEALINMENIGKTEIELCPKCGYKKTKKRNMLDLVTDYIKTKTEDPNVQDVFYAILKKHYGVRNRFVHEAKYGNVGEKMIDMIKKLGRNNFNLLDEIQYAEASQQGLYIINSFIRLELLLKLEKINSST